MRYLTVALTKGRLAQKTLDMFEKIGITCEEMRDKDTRKLIFVNEELKLRFSWQKVLTYLPTLSTVPLISALPAKTSSLKKDAKCMKSWISVSENAVCVSADRKAPVNFCRIIS